MRLIFVVYQLGQLQVRDNHRLQLQLYNVHLLLHDILNPNFALSLRIRPNFFSLRLSHDLLIYHSQPEPPGPSRSSHPNVQSPQLPIHLAHEHIAVGPCRYLPTRMRNQRQVRSRRPPPRSHHLRALRRLQQVRLSSRVGRQPRRWSLWLRNPPGR